MLGSLKHIISRDIDEEPKPSLWIEWLAKSKSDNRVSLTGCPRAEELLNQMRQQVIFLSFVSVVQGYSNLDANILTQVKDIFGEETAKKVGVFKYSLSECGPFKVPIDRDCNRIG